MALFFEPEVKKVKRSYCIVAGITILGKFRTEQRAKTALEEDAQFYKYWANTAGVSVENTTPVIRPA